MAIILSRILACMGAVRRFLCPRGPSRDGGHEGAKTPSDAKKSESPVILFFARLRVLVSWWPLRSILIYT